MTGSRTALVYAMRNQRRWQKTAGETRIKGLNGRWGVTHKCVPPHGSHPT